jgi:hypothetical protein
VAGAAGAVDALSRSRPSCRDLTSARRIAYRRDVEDRSPLHNVAPMSAIARFVAAALAACTLVATSAAQPRDVHGTSDAYASAGVALAWGVLRATGEGQAVVDIRFAVDPMTYPRVLVVALDPVGKRERLLASTPTAGLTDVRVARSTFERYPRTEFRFFGTAKEEPGETPKLVVHFVGVPDTTPEFANEARLQAYLGERIARLRASSPKPR